MSRKCHPQTLASNAGVGTNSEFQAIAPPLYLGVNYRWNRSDEKPQYDYGRSGNPTRATLECALADLEGAAGCAVTASGMAAIHLVLCLLQPGDTIIAPHDCYGGTQRLLNAYAQNGRLKVDFVDQTNLSAVEAALAKGAKMLFLETPSNPLLRITDITACTALAAKTNTLVVADNTFLSPALQNPLALGCDIVVHSTTKLINGHSDVIGGAVLAKTTELAEQLAWWANTTGVTGAPFDSYQTLRGLRTLFARVQQQQHSAGEFVEALLGRPEIKRIHYPGLPTHPGHEIAKQQQQGFGSMLSVEFADQVNVIEVLAQLRVFTIAESLGGFESLVCIPATMTHAAMPPEARQKAGISDRLVRFSIGLEHVDDLIHDLFGALDGALA
ncbi:MAG: O-succinylhomoserine (thiol)-lyase [Robiginitomaculum sp.]|nr:MAG: O-succinylhomoserine (thiol)-lyase [Robiginitomaculum sp.]